MTTIPTSPVSNAIVSHRPQPSENNEAPLQDAQLNPFVRDIARAARAVGPDTRVGVVAEILRSGPPHRMVAVVAGGEYGPGASDSPPGFLLGVVTEAHLVALLLSAPSAPARDAIRQTPVSEIMTPPQAVVFVHERASDAARRMDETQADTLPVVDAHGFLLGMAGRGDLVRDLVRPFRPPTVGGMATPMGVYLTTGRVSGGAGTGALALTGFVMFSVVIISTIAQAFIGAQLETIPAIARVAQALPVPVQSALELLIPYLAQTGLFLLLLRFSSVAGFHAAEHQVVHALERSEPLLAENVRAMPRVHPRCGTNLVAGASILMVGGMTLQPFLHEGAYALSGMVALAYWRSVGAWLQQHVTTRPATDAQIESGIRAAQELLDRHGQAPFASARPLTRLWRMGFAQIFLGFAFGSGLLWMLAFLLPGFKAAIERLIGTITLF